MAILEHFFRRGVVIAQDPGSDRKVEKRLFRCVHCQLTTISFPGSGRLKGFCENCRGDLCGRPECVAKGCLHFEAQLEQMEKGIPYALTHESLKPIVVSVPGGAIFAGISEG